jgi:tetratricopeptide (TPR) repeat protein
MTNLRDMANIRPHYPSSGLRNVMGKGKARASAQKPGQRTAALFQRAVDLHQAGRLDEAATLYGDILRKQPAHGDALLFLGHLLLDQGRMQEAAALTARAAAVNARHPVAHFNLGRVKLLQRRWEEAIGSFDRAIALMPGYAEAFNNRGHALQMLGRDEEALASFERAVALAPGDDKAHANRGVALQRAKRFEEAVASFERALALAPGNVAAHNGRGLAFMSLGRVDDAIASFDAAVAADTANADAHNYRGLALPYAGRHEEALASFDRAIALREDFADAHSNRGNVLVDLDRPADALASYRRALQWRPGDATTHHNVALCELRLGDYAQGWRDFEWRWKIERYAAVKRDFAPPLWLGRTPLQGRTILLHAEQGYGDTLQFCRYAPLVAAAGATVLLEVQRGLEPALAGLEGVSRLLAQGDALPEFDCHCPLLSLPLAFGTELPTIPAPPRYLSAAPERVAHWRAKLGERRRPRIGVVWAGNASFGNDHHRSVPLEFFAALLSLPAQFVALQKELRATDRPAFEARQGELTWFGDELRDFGDTAALVEHMDLVVSVDTAVAHLAGALGKPLWLMLPVNSDWRWLLAREDSPWYPSARLFRQARLGDWPAVVDRVGAALAEWLDGQK